MAGIRETLAQLIPSEKALLMHRSYDIVGEVAVVKLPYELNGNEREVGDAIHKLHPHIRRVFRAVGETEEIERNREPKLVWTNSKLPSTNGGTI